MRKPYILSATVAGTILLSTVAARAQAPAAQFDQRFGFSPVQRRYSEDMNRQRALIDREAPAFATEAEAETAFRNGGKWMLEFRTNATLDSNPFSSPNAQSDWYWEYGASLGYQWWNKESGIVITPSGGVSGQRYDQFGANDGDALEAGLSVEFRKLLPGGIVPSIGYHGLWAFERDFGANVYTEHDVSLSLNKVFELRPKKAPVTEAVHDGKAAKAVKTVEAAAEPDGPTLSVSLGGGHKFTDPSQSEGWYGVGSLDLDVPVTESLGITLGGGVLYRSYDDFGPQDRDTWIASAHAGVTYAITKSVAISATVNYTHSDDRIPELDYDRVLTVFEVSWKPDLNPFLHKTIGIPHYLEE